MHRGPVMTEETVVEQLKSF